MCDANNISHHRAAMENISPRGKGYPFLKVTFTTQSERWAFTRSLIATKATHKFNISPMEPREVSGWLPGYKRVARENILAALNKNGYRVNDKDVIIFTKWKYRPFHFVWQVRCQDKDINFDIHDNEAFDPQIPPCKSARKSRYADVLDSVGGEAAATGDASTPASAGGANNLDFSPPPDESAEAEEVDPEARSAMELLAKSVTSSTSESDINTTVGKRLKNPVKGKCSM